MTGKKVATFRERFCSLLESSTKSQSIIAQEFHVARQTISAWVTGQNSPRLPVVSALADYFGVSLGWLLGYDVPKEADKQKQEEYDQYIKETLANNDAVGLLRKDEADLILSYRSLSERGQRLLMDRVEELKFLYGKKSENHTAESV